MKRTLKRKTNLPSESKWRVGLFTHTTAFHLAAIPDSGIPELDTHSLFSPSSSDLSFSLL